MSQALAERTSLTLQLDAYEPDYPTCAYDAIVGGYESVDTLRKDTWKAIVGDVKKPEEVEFFRILFRWL